MPLSFLLQHIMYNITFRNCTRAATGVTISAFQLLTHSDEFVPEFMQASCVRHDAERLLRLRQHADAVLRTRDHPTSARRPFSSPLFMRRRAA